MTPAVVITAYTGQLTGAVTTAVRAALDHAGINNRTTWHKADVTLDDEGYWRRLNLWWCHRYTIITNEHDIVPDPAMYTDLAECPHEWCAHSYPIYWGNLMDYYPGSAGLGLAKFSTTLQARIPDLLSTQVPAYEPGNGRNGRFWMNLDGAISAILKGPYGMTPHRHYPDVTHLHQYQYDGAYVPEHVRQTLAPDHPLAIGSRPCPAN